jgi:hypothetical protein
MISLYASELTSIGSMLRHPDETPLGAIRQVAGVTKFGGFAQAGMALYNELCSEVTRITGQVTERLDEQWPEYTALARQAIADQIRRGGE